MCKHTAQLQTAGEQRVRKLSPIDYAIVMNVSIERASDDDVCQNMLAKNPLFETTRARHSIQY